MKKNKLTLIFLLTILIIPSITFSAGSSNNRLTLSGGLTMPSGDLDQYSQGFALMLNIFSTNNQSTGGSGGVSIAYIGEMVNDEDDTKLSGISLVPSFRYSHGSFFFQTGLGFLRASTDDSSTVTTNYHPLVNIGIGTKFDAFEILILHNALLKYDDTEDEDDYDSSYLSITIGIGF